MKKVAAVIAVVFILIFDVASGEESPVVPMPYRIGGSVTIDGVVITQANDDGLLITVTKSDGSNYTDNNGNHPQDSDGLNESNFYIISIPIYDASLQSGGAKAGEMAKLHIFKNGKEYTVSSPTGGTITIGSSGAVSQINIIATSSAQQAVLAVSPDSRYPAKEAGTTTFSVSNTGTGTMTWTAMVASGGTWLKITSGANGSNSGTITCSVAANTGSSKRTGTIRVTASGATGSPKDISVIQEGLAVKFLGAWSDGVWSWDKATNKFSMIPSTSGATMIAAGDVDSDNIDDLIGVWPSGLFVRLSSINDKWLKLSTNLPSWVVAGDLNNDGRDDIVGSWKNDGVYYLNSANGKWNKISQPARQLAVGNISGTWDDLLGVWDSGLWVRYSSNAVWQQIFSGIPLCIAAGDMTGDNRADIITSFTQGTFYLDMSVPAAAQITSTAEKLTLGDIDGDGRDDLVGVWSTGVWVRYGASGQWQQITTSKPKWIATGNITLSTQTADISIDSLDESYDNLDVFGITEIYYADSPDMMQ